MENKQKACPANLINPVNLFKLFVIDISRARLISLLQQNRWSTTLCLHQLHSVHSGKVGGSRVDLSSFWKISIMSLSDPNDSLNPSVYWGQENVDIALCFIALSSECCISDAMERNKTLPLHCTDVTRRYHCTDVTNCYLKYFVKFSIPARLLALSDDTKSHTDLDIDKCLDFSSRLF